MSVYKIYFPKLWFLGSYCMWFKGFWADWLKWIMCTVWKWVMLHGGPNVSLFPRSQKPCLFILDVFLVHVWILSRSFGLLSHGNERNVTVNTEFAFFSLVTVFMLYPACHPTNPSINSSNRNKKLCCGNKSYYFYITVWLWMHGTACLSSLMTTISINYQGSHILKNICLVPLYLVYFTYSVFRISFSLVIKITKQKCFFFIWEESGCSLLV